jgi:hypothetical protein
MVCVGLEVRTLLKLRFKHVPQDAIQGIVVGSLLTASTIPTCLTIVLSTLRSMDVQTTTYSTVTMRMLFYLPTYPADRKYACPKLCANLDGTCLSHPHPRPTLPAACAPNTHSAPPLVRSSASNGPECAHRARTKQRHRLHLRIGSAVVAQRVSSRKMQGNPNAQSTRCVRTVRPKRSYRTKCWIERVVYVGPAPTHRRRMPNSASAAVLGCTVLVFEQKVTHSRSANGIHHGTGVEARPYA